MAAPTLSYLICTVALVMLISVMPFFYSNVTNNIQKDVAQRELKEIAGLAALLFSPNLLRVNLLSSPFFCLEVDKYWYEFRG